VWAQVPETIRVEFASGGFPWTDLLVALMGGLIPAIVAYAVVVKGGRDQAAVRAEDRAAEEKERAYQRLLHERSRRIEAYADVITAVQVLTQEGKRLATLPVAEDYPTDDSYVREQRKAIHAVGTARLEAPPSGRQRLDGVLAAILFTPHPRVDPEAWTRQPGQPQADAARLTDSLSEFEHEAMADLSWHEDPWASLGSAPA
jgi:hypothetical protein